MDDETEPTLPESFADLLAALIAEAFEHGLLAEAIAVGLEEATAVVSYWLPDDR
jgi:hypothetical protein